jgi:HEAT repeat protein
VRFAALLALGIMSDRESIEIFRSYAEDNDRNVRIAAIFAMHRAGDTSRTSELSSLLFSDPDQQVRANAAMAIGLLGDPKAVKVLNVAQKDKSELVRLQCMKSLSLLGDKKATRSLIFEAHSGSGPKMVDALMALASSRTEAAEELFEYRLKEGPYEEVRLASAFGLGRLGKHDGYSLAMEMLSYRATPDKATRDDPPAQQEMRIKTLAATALGAIGDRRALESLAQAMDNETESMTLRIAAARAVLDIGRSATERAFGAPAASAVPRK